MSEAPLNVVDDTTSTPPAPSELQQLITGMESFFKRLQGGERAKAPLTNGALANFMLNSVIPAFTAMRKEYNEGFDAVIEQMDTGGGDDDDEDGEDDRDLVLASARQVIADLALFSNLLLSDRKWLGPDGNLTPDTPAGVREAYENIFTKLTALNAAADALEAGGDDSDEEDDEDGDFTDEERAWQPGDNR